MKVARKIPIEFCLSATTIIKVKRNLSADWDIVQWLAIPFTSYLEEAQKIVTLKKIKIIDVL